MVTNNPRRHVTAVASNIANNRRLYRLFRCRCPAGGRAERPPASLGEDNRNAIISKQVTIHPWRPPYVGHS